MNMPSQDEINESALKHLNELWGRTPDWNDFKLASEEGRLRVSKPMALKYLYAPLVPNAYKILFGIVTMWAWILAVPICLIGWVFFDWNAWWILGGFIVAWYLKDVSRNGHCQAIEQTALKHEEFYIKLVHEGAFLFSPPEGQK